MVFYYWTRCSSSVRSNAHVLFEHKTHHIGAKYQFDLAKHGT